jgi:uncharacterized protein
MTRASPLFSAAEQGDPAKIRKWLKAGHSPNVVDDRKETPIWRAIARVRRGDDTSSEGHLEVIQVLLENGADPNHKNSKGRSTFLEAIGTKNHPLMMQLLAHRADPKTPDALALACIWRMKRLAEVLLARGADVNQADEDGCTPLFWAASTNRLPFVKLFLAHGADPNVGNDAAITPIMVAKESLAIAKYLLAHGADPSLRNRRGQTALEFMSEHWPREAAKVIAWLRQVESGKSPAK